MAISIPTLKIKKILDTLVSIIRLDYTTHKAAGTYQDSWLWRVFGGVKYGNFDYYVQAIEILCTRDDNSPRKLNIRKEFSLVDKPLCPTIYINSPSEREEGVNSIGYGQDTGLYYVNQDGSTTDQYFATFGGDYELIVYSPNPDENELLYRFLEALFISANDTLTLSFDGIFKFSGKLLMMKEDALSPPIFMKSWAIYIQHRVEVPKLAISETMLNDIEFEGHFAEEPPPYGEGAIGENEL